MGDSKRSKVTFDTQQTHQTQEFAKNTKIYAINYEEIPEEDDENNAQQPIKKSNTTQNNASKILDHHGKSGNISNEESQMILVEDQHTTLKFDRP